MLTDKQKQDSTGIYIYDTKTFYFLITGPLPYDVNKLHNILSGRGLIKVNREGKTTDYKLMSHKDADEAGYSVEYCFVSPIVKLAWDKAQTTAPSSKLWG